MKTCNRSLLVATGVLLSFLLIGCSDKPSGSEMRKAIERLSKAEGFKKCDSFTSRGFTHAGFWIKDSSGDTVHKCHKVRYEEIEVEQWGDKSKGDDGYWPAKVRVVGSAECCTPLSKPSGMKRFNTVVKFRFYKDDHDEWKARLSNTW